MNAQEMMNSDDRYEAISYIIHLLSTKGKDVTVWKVEIEGVFNYHLVFGKTKEGSDKAILLHRLELDRLQELHSITFKGD